MESLKLNQLKRYNQRLIDYIMSLRNTKLDLDEILNYIVDKY